MGGILRSSSGLDGGGALADHMLVEPAIEGEARAVLLANLHDVHVRRRLHGMHAVDPGIQEGIDYRVHVAVGILIEDPRAPVGEKIPDATVSRDR